MDIEYYKLHFLVVFPLKEFTVLHPYETLTEFVAWELEREQTLSAVPEVSMIVAFSVAESYNC